MPMDSLERLNELNYRGKNLTQKNDFKLMEVPVC